MMRVMKKIKDFMVLMMKKKKKIKDLTVLITKAMTSATAGDIASDLYRLSCLDI